MKPSFSGSLWDWVLTSLSDCVASLQVSEDIPTPSMLLREREPRSATSQKFTLFKEQKMSKKMEGERVWKGWEKDHFLFAVKILLCVFIVFFWFGAYLLSCVIVFQRKDALSNGSDHIVCVRITCQFFLEIMLFVLWTSLPTASACQAPWMQPAVIRRPALPPPLTAMTISWSANLFQC